MEWLREYEKEVFLVAHPRNPFQGKNPLRGQRQMDIAVHSINGCDLKYILSTFD